MKEIPLTKGKIALVDDDDYEELSKHKWHTSHHGYPARSILKPKKENIFMHRQLMGFPDCAVDHINRNPLDNRRSNLRLATLSQNQHNRKLNKNNTSGFKGVSWHPSMKKWVATIRLNYKQYILGYFSDPKDAALAYREAALELHGEFASW